MKKTIIEAYTSPVCRPIAVRVASVLCGSLKTPSISDWEEDDEELEC